MAGMPTATEGQLSQIGHYFMTISMFPVFLFAHLIVSCILIRADSTDLGPKFTQKHPLTSWLCTLITCLSGDFVVNFLFREPLIGPVNDHFMLVAITIVWYFVNYSTSDVVYKFVTLKPFLLAASILQECLRVRVIYLGVHQAASLYPSSYIIIILRGVIYGNGYGFIKIVENLIRGKWDPKTNEILYVTYFTKSSVYASILFLLQHLQLLNIPIELLYLSVLITAVIFRVMMTVGEVKDPLLQLERPVCSLLFGSDSEEVQEVEVGDNKTK